MPTATVTSKGQITIPKEIREHLQVHPGDSVDFVVLEDGRVILKQATLEIQALEGILHRPGMRKITVGEMNQIIRSRGAGRR